MKGPGDSATWPPFTGHPNDPRHPGVPECFLCSEELTFFEDGSLVCGYCGDKTFPPEPDIECVP